LLALELLDYSTNYCDIPLHTQLASNTFMKSLQTLLLRRSKKLKPVVFTKICFLCQLWHTLYAGKREIISGFADNYNLLKQNGIPFPPNIDSKYSSLRKLAPLFAILIWLL